MSQGHNPVSVTFTERSAAATVALHELSMRQNSDGFWLFLSGLRLGGIFSKNEDDFQVLIGATKSIGDARRLGKRDVDGFVLILEDNA